MTNGIVRRLFRMFTAALLGYLWGWIWGWSLFDPNTDIWALAAALGAVAALALGNLSSIRQYDTLLLSMTFGLYLGWIARTYLFGDIPGGWGILLMTGGVVLGGVIGMRLHHKADPAILPGLVGALYIGFFGGFLIDAIILDKMLGWMPVHTILNQAPATIICGAVGGIGVARWMAIRDS